MRVSKAMGVFASLLAMLALSSCGGSSSGTQPSQQMGGMFTIGTDSPTIPSVVSVQVQITSITLTDGTTTVNLLNGPQIVDFAELNGLRSLLDLENVTAGTYTSANITVGTVMIQYLDTTQSPPALKTIPATVSPMTVTQALKTPLVLADNDLVGFFMDLDLRQSIQTDMNGNVTGNFTPTFDVKGLSVDDADAQIDCFYAGVVSVNPAGNQFVIQGPRGRQFTVDTTTSTNFDSSECPQATIRTPSSKSPALSIGSRATSPRPKWKWFRQITSSLRVSIRLFNRPTARRAASMFTPGQNFPILPDIRSDRSIQFLSPAWRSNDCGSPHPAHLASFWAIEPVGRATGSFWRQTRYDCTSAGSYRSSRRSGTPRTTR